MFDLAKPS
jgi:hypothetical protein